MEGPVFKGCSKSLQEWNHYTIQKLPEETSHNFCDKKTPTNCVGSEKSKAMPKTQTKMTHPHIGMSPRFDGFIPKILEMSPGAPTASGR